MLEYYGKAHLDTALRGLSFRSTVVNSPMHMFYVTEMMTPADTVPTSKVGFPRKDIMHLSGVEAVAIRFHENTFFIVLHKV